MRAAIAMAAAVVACAAPAPAEPTTERLEQVIWLKPRGEVEVEETHIVRFDAAGVNTVVRDLPVAYPVIAVIVSAAIDGRVVVFDDEIGDERSGVQVHTRRGLRQVRWNVSPQAGSIHTFAVSYLLWNAVRQDALGDYFRWRVTPISPPGRIENALVRLAFSQPLTRQPEIRGGAAEVYFGPAENRLTLMARAIPKREPLQLTLRFEAGSAVGSGLRWQSLRQERRRRAMLVLAAAAAALLAVLAVHVARRRSRGS